MHAPIEDDFEAPQSNTLKLHTGTLGDFDTDTDTHTHTQRQREREDSDICAHRTNTCAWTEAWGEEDIPS